MKIEQILEKLISFNTVKDKENNQINKYLADFLQPLGFKTKLVKNPKDSRTNLFAKFNERRKTVLTFSAHTDTLPPDKNLLPSPLKLDIKGDKLYGLGVGEVKGSIASILKVINDYDIEKLKRGINLVFTYGQTDDLAGIQEFFKKIKLKTKYTILGENTGLKPVVAAKGLYNIRVKIYGKTVNGFVTMKEANPILIAQEFTLKLNRYFNSLKRTQNSLFDRPFATLNITKIQGADKVKQLASSCLIEFEYRTINENQGAKIYQNILEILNSLECKYKISLKKQINTMKVKRREFINEIEEISGQEAFGCNGLTEGAFYSKHDYDCIILGPGNSSVNSSPEFIGLEDLNNTVKIYEKIIEKYCL